MARGPRSLLTQCGGTHGWMRLTPARLNGMMPPKEGPPMERQGIRLNRRAFVLGAAGLGLVAGCGRLPGQAEAPAKVPRIGVLAFVTADPSAADNAAFRQGLRDLGYSEGPNITLEW